MFLAWPFLANPKRLVYALLFVKSELIYAIKNINPKPQVKLF